MQLGEVVKGFLSVARSNVWFLEGMAEGSGGSLRVLYCGGERQKDYIARLVFGGEYQESYRGKLYFWQLLRLLRRRQGFSLAFIEGRDSQRRLFQQAEDFYLPLWLNSRLDIPLQAKNQSAKSDLRIIRKNELYADATRDRQLLREFYDNMYLATLRARHGGEAVIHSFAEVERVVNEADNQLLMIRQGATAIAGVVIQMAEVPKLFVSGILNSDDRYRKIGVTGAIYFFPAQYLAERGFTEMDIGRSRSFLSDGIFRYKSKWHHKLSGCDPDGMIVKILDPSPALAGFLASHPFASVEAGEIRANVFLASPGDLTPARRKEIDAINSLRGLAGVDVYRLEDASSRPQPLATWPLPDDREE